MTGAVAPTPRPEGAVPPALAGVDGLHQAVFRVERPCVYFLCLGDEVRYVGQTVCLQARLEDHRYVKEFDRVFFVDVPEASLNAVERRHIQALQPPDNDAGKGQGSAPSTEDLQRRWPLMRGRKAKPPQVDEGLARAAARLALEALAEELGRLDPARGSRMVSAQADGSVERLATVEMIQRAALAAAEKVAS